MAELTRDYIQKEIKLLLEYGGNVEIPPDKVQDAVFLDNLKDHCLEKLASGLAGIFLEIMESIRINYTGGLTATVEEVEYPVQGDFGCEIKLIKEEDEQ